MSAAQCHVCEGWAEAPAEAVAHRGAHWVAIAAGDVPGWLRLQTIRHGEWLWDMTGDEAAEFGPLVAALSAALRRVTGAERVYLIALGENSLHVHALLIPRYQDTPREERGPGILATAASRADREVAYRVAAAVRRELIAG
jgi:diadenosine tetraphosphate (Ap4A) HIT family hydrolase